MKRIILFFSLAIGLSCFAQGQKALNAISNIKFYGIDYSLAQVYGASETPTQFLNAFDAINKLFISEPKKYDVEKYSGKRVDAISLEAVDMANKTIDPNQLMTTNQHYTLNQEAIAKAVRLLSIPKEQGTGLVMIAELLNKPDERASYQVVFFNLENKEIITSWRAEGKAQGFGIRNYWAYSAYKVLKDFKHASPAKSNEYDLH